MAQFRVDLRGIVEILSQHLYSSPRVFVRELLQNGVDAITERRRLDPAAPAAITITVQPAELGGEVCFADSGVGLTGPEVESLLATIGRSSKRDEFDLQRDDLLGQFGIGLLSAFLVSDAIEVRTRSARTPDAPTVSWIGRGDGTYDVAESDRPLAAPGTEVRLRPRPGEQWLRPEMVRDLARYYGSLLPFPITFDAGLRGVTHDALPGATAIAATAIAPHRAPWELRGDDLTDVCVAAFGFSPMAVIPLRVELTGVTGVAFVLPTSVNPAEPSRHRVFLRRMMLAESAEGLLPDWAYFVRTVVDVEGLRPTASREALYDDDLLAATREELGRQIRAWVLRTAGTDPELLEHFLVVHGLGVKSIALYDDEMFDLVRAFSPWRTTTGTTTLADLARRTPQIDYARTSREYDALATVATAQGVTVVDAGHTYDVELLERLVEREPWLSVRPVGAGDILARVLPPGETPPALRTLAALGTTALAAQECAVDVRAFEPATTPALYVPDPERDRRAVDREGRAAAEGNPLLAGLLDAPTAPAPASTATVVLNAANPVVTAVAGLVAAPDGTTDHDLVADVVRGLYAVALLSGGHRMTDADRGLLSRSFLALLERAGDTR